MFTGLVQSRSRIVSLENSPAGRRLVVKRPPRHPSPSAAGLSASLAHGDSVCVSGVCLTAVDLTDSTLGFDVITQTLEMTKLGDLTAGDAVNLEAAVTPQQPLGGHFMQGHVDGVGRITAVRDDPEQWRITVQAPPEVAEYLVPKGSVAVDGVSLTLAAVHDDGRFEVALIPETLKATTLGTAAVGDRVNLEADILSKTVVHHLRRTAQRQTKSNSSVTMQMLNDAGFASYISIVRSRQCRRIDREGGGLQETSDQDPTRGSYGVVWLSLRDRPHTDAVRGVAVGRHIRQRPNAGADHRQIVALVERAALQIEPAL